MRTDDELQQFILAHREDDVRHLALQASRYPGIDITYALTQIAGWQKMREKNPSWAHCPAIIYPPHLPLEQCSSEQTALYKKHLIQQHASATDSFADLTGGFGIDCSCISTLFQHSTYVERQETLCELATHNFQVLGLPIRVLNDTSQSFLENKNHYNWLFLDPARRDAHGGKTIAIGDCEPDVGDLEETLVSRADHVMVKLSPMLDLDLACKQLKHIAEAHIISVDNECKELLLILSKTVTTDVEHTPIHCVNIKKGEVQTFVFCKAEEQQTTYHLAQQMRHYLYEPNASILKAGAYRCLGRRYDLQKLHANSHLYTADKVVVDFPGRVFEVEATCGFGKKELKTMLTGIDQANLTIRNFPASVAELRKRLHLADGGSTYLFATTLSPQQKILVKCKHLP
ncbi:MAG: SAM-dependent methyltransferase [Bacteroidaceae bacterium]|nr:SAM-dependent methyltransferase [Bacteroidaceae bacterium]